jgi:hypothetical protein
MSSSATPPEERARVKKAIADGPFGRKNKANTQFPQPRSTTLGFKNAKYFFEYWHSIPENLRDLIDVRVYRTWPQIKMELVEPERRDHCWELIHGPCPFDPENYEVQLMMRDGYGSGDWRFDLKEVGTDPIIIRAYVRAQDMQTFPPVVDYRTLVNTNANQEYIRGLMKRNIKLPWDYTPEEENENMAGTGSEALKTMAESVTEIAKVAVESANAAADARVEAAEARAADTEDAPPNNPIEQAAVTATIGVMAHGFEKTMDMMAKHAGNQYDPIAMMHAAKELMTGNGDGSGTQIVLTTLREMQTENMKFLKEVMEQRAAPTVTAQDPLALMLEKSAQIKQMADLFGWGPPERDEPPPPPPAAPRAPEKSFGQQITENIVPIVSGLSMIMGMAANIFYNMKAKEPRNPADDMAAAAANNPLAQMTQMPGAVPPAMQQPAMPANPLDQFRPFIKNISGALLVHFFGTDQGYDGHTFAEYILGDGKGGPPVPQGRQAYGTIKETLKREGFDQLVREHFDLWSKLQGTPQQYQKFLDDFFGYDDWAREQDRAEGSGAAA